MMPKKIEITHSREQVALVKIFICSIDRPSFPTRLVLKKSSKTKQKSFSTPLARVCADRQNMTDPVSNCGGWRQKRYRHTNRGKKTTTPAVIPTWENRQLDQEKTKQKPTPHMDEGKRVWFIFQKADPGFPPRNPLFCILPTICKVSRGTN